MRREPTIAVAFILTAAILTACGGGNDDVATLGPVPTAQPTGNASPSVVTSPSAVVPSGSPGSASPTGVPIFVTGGTASVTVVGGLQTTQTDLPLTPPASYALAPGSFALGWGSTAAGVSIDGATFTGTARTSDALRLSFFVHASSGTYTFTSVNGGCSVTVGEADATAFSGTFTCATITDDGGSVRVGARGAFAATT